MTVTIREARSKDASSLRDVHLAAIEGLETDAYDADQLAAWAHDRDPEQYPIDAPETHVVVAETDVRLVVFGWLQTETEGYAEASVGG